MYMSYVLVIKNKWSHDIDTYFSELYLDLGKCIKIYHDN